MRDSAMPRKGRWQLIANMHCLEVRRFAQTLTKLERCGRGALHHDLPMKPVRHVYMYTAMLLQACLEGSLKVAYAVHTVSLVASN